MGGIIRTTYEIITPESAEEGDFAESGWEDEEGTAYTREEAIAFLRGCAPSSTSFHRGVWYLGTDPDVDYATGAETRRSYHLAEKTWNDADERAIFDAVTRGMIGIFRGSEE